MIQITKHKNTVYCNTEKNIIELIILILIFYQSKCSMYLQMYNIVFNGNNTQQDILPNTWILFLQHQAEN